MKKIISMIKLTVIIVLVLVVCIVGINMYVINFAKPYMDISIIDKVDAVIIPGARVNGNVVSWTLQARLDEGLAIYKNGKAPKIIVTGDHGSDSYDEVNAMRKYLMDKGVKSEDIFMDHVGFNTYASMYRARDIFCVRSAIVTSQEYHNIRCVYIGKNLGLEVYSSSAKDVYIGPYRFVREPLAKVKAVIDVKLLKPKPKYLGDTIPVWGDGNVTDDGKG